MESSVARAHQQSRRSMAAGRADFFDVVVNNDASSASVARRRSPASYRRARRFASLEFNSIRAPPAAGGIFEPPPLRAQLEQRRQQQQKAAAVKRRRERSRGHARPSRDGYRAAREPLLCRRRRRRGSERWIEFVRSLTWAAAAAAALVPLASGRPAGKSAGVIAIRPVIAGGRIRGRSRGDI